MVGRPANMHRDPLEPRNRNRNGPQPRAFQGRDRLNGLVFSRSEARAAAYPEDWDPGAAHLVAPPPPRRC